MKVWKFKHSGSQTFFVGLFPFGKRKLSKTPNTPGPQKYIVTTHHVYCINIGTFKRQFLPFFFVLSEKFVVYFYTHTHTHQNSFLIIFVQFKPPTLWKVWRIISYFFSLLRRNPLFVPMTWSKGSDLLTCCKFTCLQTSGRIYPWIVVNPVMALLSLQTQNVLITAISVGYVWWIYLYVTAAI